MRISRILSGFTGVCFRVYRGFHKGRRYGFYAGSAWACIGFLFVRALQLFGDTL